MRGNKPCRRAWLSPCRMTEHWKKMLVQRQQRGNTASCSLGQAQARYLCWIKMLGQCPMGCASDHRMLGQRRCGDPFARRMLGQHQRWSTRGKKMLGQRTRANPRERDMLGQWRGPYTCAKEMLGHHRPAHYAAGRMLGQRQRTGHLPECTNIFRPQPWPTFHEAQACAQGGPHATRDTPLR